MDWGTKKSLGLRTIFFLERAGFENSYKKPGEAEPQNTNKCTTKQLPRSLIAFQHDVSRNNEDFQEKPC
jgi:hypothetical protein